MSTFLNSYPLFENNQVLTSSQLNELVAYLDEQNRLTRVKLIGDGIACGLEVQANAPVNPTEIVISAGVGVTSQGYLIVEGDCVLTRYRPYTLPAAVSYLPFEDPATTVQDVTLYELLTADAPVLPTDDVKLLNDPIGFANDKIVLLFLECVPVDQNSCIGKSCDTIGSEFVMNIRRLLINQIDMNKVLDRTCRQAALFEEKYNLPEIFMKRALFDPIYPSTNATNYFTFSETYVNAMKAVAQPASGVSIYDQVFNALRQSFVDFSPILSDQYGGVNPFDNYPDASWTNFMNGSSTGPRYLGMQYFYNFIRDLILAYNEFRDVAFDLMSECCADMDCFPKHLMLGEVLGTGSSAPSAYRNYFVTTPIFNNQKEKAERTISLFQRMVLMTRKFNLARINNPSTTIVSPNTLAVPIYITPSKEKRDPLSERSIPYYYNIHDAEADLGTLEQSWNYDYKLKNLFAKGLAPLAYENQDAVQATDQGPVKTPLYYDTDPYNFLRIEGPIRSHYSAAKNEIERIKADFDLPFNVVALRLTGDPFDDITERCNFDDLRTEYGSIRLEMLSLMKNLLDRFGSPVSDGTYHVKPLPGFITALQTDANTGITNGSIQQPQIGVTTLLAAASFTTGTIAIDSSTAATFTDAGVSNPNNADNLAFRSFNPAPAAAATTTPPPLFSPTTPPLAVSISLPLFPVFALQRTMNQVKTKLTSDTQQMLNALNTLFTNMLPFNITQFRFGYTGTVQDTTLGFIQNYFNALQSAINVKVGFNQMLDLILRSTKIKNTPELYMDLAAYWDEVVGLLEKFITDPKYKSLTQVSYTLQYRLNQLKANDMTLFSNFIKKNPGVQPGNGVPMGGTYILVYNGNSIAVDPIRRNVVINQIRDVRNMEAAKQRIMAKPVISQEDQFTLSSINATLVDIGQVSIDLASSVPVEKIAIEADQVIADFYLPYLCCCDCECDSIDHVTTVGQLNMPALAVPFYAEYSLGDYAFGKDVDVATVGAQISPGQLTIDIIPMLQYEDQLFTDKQIRLYLVDRSGNKLTTRVFTSPLENPSLRTSSILEITPMSTGNYPNQPIQNPQSGTAKVMYDTTFSNRQTLAYVPVKGFTGVDSFYYMYEIVGTGGETDIVRRSAMAEVTIHVLPPLPASGTTGTTGTTGGTSGNTAAQNPQNEATA